MTTGSRKKTGKTRGTKKKAAKKRAPAATSRVRKTAKKRAKPAKPKAASPVLKLSGRLSIRELGTLAEQLARQPETVDVAGLESVDTAALQLLVAYANSARRDDRGVAWTGREGALGSALTLAGLAHCIDFGTASADEDDELCPVF